MAKDVISLDRETYRILLWGVYMALARHVDPLKQTTTTDLLPHLQDLDENSEEGLLRGITNMVSYTPTVFEETIKKEARTDGE